MSDSTWILYVRMPQFIEFSMESKVLFRTFIAIPVRIPPELHNTLKHFQQEFSDERIRWVDPSQMHITLRFIGDIPEEQVNAVKANFRVTYDAFERIELHLSGLRTFNHRSALKVLWAGIEGGDMLRALHLATQRLLDEIVPLPDQYTFRPHLTLARIRRLREAGRFQGEVDRFRNREFGACGIGEVVFLRSVLRSSGAVYEILEKAELRQQDG